MDEFTAAVAARKFASGLDLSGVAQSLDVYLDNIGATLRFEAMGPNESGYTVKKASGPRIVVNSNEPTPRQRFTICHEIAHIVLDLPSMHVEIPSWAFVKRDDNESACDVFAAELLLPYALFKTETNGFDPSLEALQELGVKFGASLPATASRFAALSDEACAFVMCEHGSVRYSVRSAALRSRNAWIDRNGPIPPLSIAHGLREKRESGIGAGSISQDIWFSEWDQSSELVEHAKHFQRFDQTIALLWCESEDLGERVKPKHDRSANYRQDEYRELTGELEWRKKGR